MNKRTYSIFSFIFCHIITVNCYGENDKIPFASIKIHQIQNVQSSKEILKNNNQPGDFPVDSYLLGRTILNKSTVSPQEYGKFAEAYEQKACMEETNSTCDDSEDGKASCCARYASDLKINNI